MGNTKDFSCYFVSSCFLSEVLYYLDPLDRENFFLYFSIFCGGAGLLSWNLNQVIDQKAMWKWFTLVVHSVEFIKHLFCAIISDAMDGTNLTFKGFEICWKTKRV